MGEIFNHSASGTGEAKEEKPVPMENKTEAKPEQEEKIDMNTLTKLRFWLERKPPQTPDDQNWRTYQLKYNLIITWPDSLIIKLINNFADSLELDRSRPLYEALIKAAEDKKIIRQLF